MKNRYLLITILYILSGNSSYAAKDDTSIDNYFLNNHNYLALSDNYYRQLNRDNLNLSSNNNQISISVNEADWIKTPVVQQNAIYSLTSEKSLSYSNELRLDNDLSFAWSISNFLSVNLNIFDKQFHQYNNPLVNNTGNSFAQLDNSITFPVSTNEQYNISGYKFGISSKLGLGNNYKLDINLDYGQLEGINLAGLNSNEISTTSFALGIRKSKFGASLNTDIYLDGNVELMDYTRLGFEFDWYFSEDSKLSVGSKQRLNSDVVNGQSNSLDSLTGNVQYIKFQHDL